MLPSRASNLAALALLLSATAFAGDTKPDYSQESAVYDHIRSTMRFENDGSAVQDSSIEVRVQSPAAVQQLGVIMMNYASATDKIDIEVDGGVGGISIQ